MCRVSTFPFGLSYASEKYTGFKKVEPFFKTNKHLLNSISSLLNLQILHRNNLKAAYVDS